ncbi:MAG: magnesium/cobalt transporter CorA [bacterium]|jgi:magnesium transporter
MGLKFRRPKLHKFEIERRHAPGTAPGTLSVDPEARPTTISVIAYSPDAFIEEKIEDASRIEELRAEFPVIWVDIAGLADHDKLVAVARIFGLHGLALEDVVHTHQRSKAEDYGDHLFVVARMIKLHPEHHEVETEQLSVFVGESFVVTFQEEIGDCFDPIREMLRHGRGKLRGLKADYLAYSLVDAVIDGYFPVLEHIGEELEELEDETLHKPDTTTIADINHVKRSLVTIRRAVWPLREVVNVLLRDPTDIFGEETRLHMRDCYDHAVGIIDLVESYREVSSGLIDMYLSSVSNRMNEIMKVLTMIATIFIPITFIAGIYGMNFDTEASPYNMPELGLKYGYLFFWGAILLVSVLMVAFFKRKKWL